MLNEKEFNVDDSLNLDEFFDAPVKPKPKVSVGENQLLLPSGKLITFNEQQTEALKRIKNWLKSDKQFFTLEGFAGTGKQQPIDCLVQTPNGSRKIGELKIGDYVFGVNGKPIKVLNIFPQGIKQAYEITFRDNMSTEAGEDHLWSVWTHKLRAKRKPTITLTTKNLIDNGLEYNYSNGDKIHKYSIPLSSPVEYEEKDLPIPPYMLGALIGDGSSLGKTPLITVPDMDNEIIDNIREVMPQYVEIHSNRSSSCPKYTFIDTDNYKSNKLNKHFKALGLNVKSIDRFIPTIYKQASIEQRYELLKGLMDTDGCSRGNRISFSTSSKKLLCDVIELVQSLGGIAIKHADDNGSKNTNYCINIKMFVNPFKLKRKANNWKFSQKNPPSRHIISIKKSRIVEQVCISVDSADGLYLTDNYIVTHNSTIVKKVLDTYRYGVVVSAPTHQARKIISNTTGREGKTLHSLLGLRPDVDLEIFDPNRPIFSAIAPPKINDYNWVVLDEGSMVNSYLFELMHKLIIGKRTKLLVMGDRAQLPPIQQVISPVFTHPDIERYQLTKVERQSDDNPLMPVYDALRDNLDSVDGGFVRKTHLNNNGDGIIITINKKEFREMVLEKFKSEEYKKDSDFVKGLAWKNDTVMSSNKVVRDELFGKTADIVEVDDVLRGYRTVTNEKQNYNIIENSADYKVMSKSIVRENAYGISGYDVKLREDIGKGKFKFDDVFIINSNDHENLHLYAQMHDFFRDMGKTNKKAWRKYYEFRRCNLLMVNIEKHKNGTLRSSSDIINRDIYYGYFITVHKAQGSTYTNCIVMDTDINLNWDIVERNKLRYVALSRPTSKAIVLTSKLDY